MAVQDYDVMVIGGGINAAGIAAEAALRGLSVVLCEAGDLAAATSSASSKLIHGGLRYLEQYNFRLVKEALMERKTLMRIAPHLVEPQAFVLPLAKNIRSQWKIRLGLKLYDALSPKGLARSTRWDLAKEQYRLRSDFTSGYRYSDCATDDARLVLANLQCADQNGADIFLYTKVVAAERGPHAWQVTVESAKGRGFFSVGAVINATGPWVADVARDILGIAPLSVQWIKGSHIVVPRLYPSDDALILQLADGRVIFTIPYQANTTLVGTTDVPYTGDLAALTISQHEQDYLLEALAQYFEDPPRSGDIITSFAGVRTLVDGRDCKASELSREYHLALNDEGGRPPCLSVYGGKVTTYRMLAQKAVEAIRPWFKQIDPVSKSASTLLPGSDFMGLTKQAYIKLIYQRYPYFAKQHLDRLVNTYGSAITQLLAEAVLPEDLGPLYCGDFSERELHYLLSEEWACTVEDVLWRRTKIGLIADKTASDAIEAAIADFKRSRTAARSDLVNHEDVK